MQIDKDQTIYNTELWFKATAASGVGVQTKSSAALSSEWSSLGLQCRPCSILPHGLSMQNQPGKAEYVFKPITHF